MTLGEVETRVRNFLGPDTIETPFPQAELWALINECYVEYIARFTSAWKRCDPVFAGTSPIFFIGTDSDGQWIDAETLEAWDGVTRDPDTNQAVWIPLKRRTEGQVLFMNRTEGVTGPPRIYSLSLVERVLAAQRSKFFARVYPFPDTTYTYRARIRSWPTNPIFFTEDLLSAGDVLQQMDDEQGEQLAAWVAIRAGNVYGFPRDQVAALIASLPYELAAEVQIAAEMAWTMSQPRGVAHSARVA